MDKAIADMTNKGMKNIADLGVEAFIELLLEQGSVSIGDDPYGKTELLKIWTDVAKDAFKSAAKGGKKKSSKVSTDKPKRAKSGYLLFCETRRPELNQKHNKDFKAVATALGEEWTALGEKGKAEWNTKAKSEVVQQVDLIQVDTDNTVEYATKAAETFAQENNLVEKITSGNITGTGKEKNGVKAIKLSDLKDFLKKATDDSEAEDEAEDEDDDEDDPNSWIGWNGQVWKTEEEDWMPGVITKYTAKTKKHTIEYEDESTEEINIKELEKKKEFEWIDED